MQPAIYLLRPPNYIFITQPPKLLCTLPNPKTLQHARHPTRKRLHQLTIGVRALKTKAPLANTKLKPAVPAENSLPRRARRSASSANLSRRFGKKERQERAATSTRLSTTVDPDNHEVRKAAAAGSVSTASHWHILRSFARATAQQRRPRIARPPPTRCFFPGAAGEFRWEMLKRACERQCRVDAVNRGGPGKLSRSNEISC